MLPSTGRRRDDACGHPHWGTLRYLLGRLRGFLGEPHAAIPKRDQTDTATGLPLAADS